MPAKKLMQKLLEFKPNNYFEGKMEKELKFEDKIKRIEEIVDTLDNGDTNLEDMLKLYEEGMKLAAESREFLDKAEQKVIDIKEVKYRPNIDTNDFNIKTKNVIKFFMEKYQSKSCKLRRFIA